MGDTWFEIADLSHFWIRRRFEVLLKLTRKVVWENLLVAEVGCGNGLLQRQCEERLAIEVDGFDLNEFALERNVARRSRVFCYDITERRAEFDGKYDIIFAFDVLEHITEERSFLEGLKFHIKPEGLLILNAPAHQVFFSAYDRAVGHVAQVDIIGAG